MVDQIIPEVILQVPGLLEKILKHLPEPTQVEVKIWGEFDYSDISRQIEHSVPGIKLKPCGYGDLVVFGLENPSKEKILEIIRKGRSTEEERKKGIWKNILWRKAHWHLDNNVNIELSAYGIKADYRGSQPDYISKIIKEIGENYIKSQIQFGEDIF